MEEVSSQDFQEKNESLMKDYDKVKAYNLNINEHHPSFFPYTPTRNILIRIFRRMPVVTEDGLMFDSPDFTDFAKVQKVAGSGQTYTVKEQLSQFSFTQKAIVVKLPLEYAGKLKIGDVVNIEQLLVQGAKIGDTTYQEYMYQFVHPDSNTTVPTSDCSNPFYGYALVPETIIKGWL
jgi:hypothetical protein